MRLNLRLSGSAEKLILDLADSIGASPKDVVLDSLSLFQMVARETQNGGQVGVQDRHNQFKAIVTPILQSIAEAAIAEERASHKKKEIA